MNNESLEPKEPHFKEQFETDSQKIVRRHLENESDIITDEDIRSVRIGISPSHEVQSEQNLEELIDDIESEREKDDDTDVATTDNPITPWDTIER
ncbi:MAG: hypothetical protein JWR72_2431 [Flavisolibacter sp.]|jgi:hypothetical protein|nr:hypothetical protein [Flavisolibacter sp.]